MKLKVENLDEVVIEGDEREKNFLEKEDKNGFVKEEKQIKYIKYIQLKIVGQK